MPDNDVKQITVAGISVGMRGLDAVFSELKASGKQPSVGLGGVLVEMARRHNYVPDAARTEYANALLREYRRYLGEEVPEERTAGLSIKVLGMGCSRCEALASNVRSALAKLGLAADVEHVQDARRIAEYGVLGVPALVVDGKVVSVGKTLTTEQVVRLLEKLEQSQ
ncbi:MAG: thioredoxin family protein [Candidatus Eisenbacteria bacterium]|nr:thioredoxin family protein [Candidatus Eisenbacteria bacterium]